MDCPYAMPGDDCKVINGECHQITSNSCVIRLRADCKYLKGLIEEAHHVIQRDCIIDGPITELLTRMEQAL